MLDGSFTGALFQVGADAGQTIAVNSIVDANIDQLGRAGFADTVSGAGVGGTAATASGAIKGIAVSIRAAGAPAGAAGVTTITLDDVKIEVGDDAAAVQKKIAQAFNNKLDQTGLYAEVSGGNIRLTSLKAGQDFEGVSNGTLSGGTGITLSLAADLPASVASAGTAAAGGGINHLENLDISNFAGAQRALEIVDKSLTAVSGSRAEMGAIQNRFTSTIANLSTTSENLSASRSRIRDADYAKETAEMTRTQILQQAGTAMLAQANQVPQNVLNLLK
ncbi:MAG: hypothetical protein B7X39_21005 [Lysobacterales bacterium 14-68-21]|nr:MAG: hypothetical protein B7X39_21005 [Xanthomonadales bacterium 14-68-21]